MNYRTVRIKNIDSDELKLYRGLNENQIRRIYEPEAGIFIAETPLVVKRAADAGYEPESFLIEEKYLTNDRKAAEEVFSAVKTEEEIIVYTAPYEEIIKLTGYSLTKGFLSAMKRKTLKKPDEIMPKKGRFALLEDVMNPSNVGAIFRSAAAMGIEAVFLTKACSDPLYRRSVRVSMGNVFQIPWTFLEEDIKDFIKRERKNGCCFAAMALLDDSLSVDDDILKKHEKLGIVLGTEGEGLDTETIAACDHTVKIPMHNGVDSLNVAAASAVAFWELSKVLC